MANETSLVTYIEDAFDVDLSVEALNVTINEKLYDSGVFDIDISTIGDATTEGSSADAKLTLLLADVGTLCGCPTSSDLYTTVTNDLTAMQSNLTSAIDGITSTTALLSTLITDLNPVRAAIPTLLSAVQGINDALGCGWQCRTSKRARADEAYRRQRRA